MEAIITLIVLQVIGAGYKVYQDKITELGGKIAWSKSLWLTYTIYTWFLLPPILYLYSSSETWLALSPISASFWVRGFIELFMLFVTKNWKPIYGITHNTFTIILGLLFYNTLSIQLSVSECFFIITVYMGLCFETYYAFFFHKFVGKKTQGDEAVWFANKEDPVFKKVLQVTTVGNIITYSGLIYFLLYFIIKA